MTAPSRPDVGSTAGSGGLTEEERLVQQTAREFARRELAPGAAERDEQERYDRALFTRMGELGLTAVPFPESVGGAGFSYRAWTLVMEEIAYADMAMAVSLSVHILAQYPIVTWGTDEQRARWLPRMLAGAEMGAFALTEPHAGSDAAALSLRAERVGDPDAPSAYLLTGTKIWITNAIEAELYIVFATLDQALGTKAITAFVVEKGTPGFTFGTTERKMGIRSDTASELIFDGCAVPADNRLGEEGAGYRIALSALGEGRISIAAACTGLAQAALDHAARYVTAGRECGVSGF
jgi:butyryl-CoA dehydrogenase